MSTRPSFDPDRVARVHFQPVVGTAFEPAVLHFMAAGTVTLVPVDGDDSNALAYDVVQGQVLPILCKKITAVSGIAI